MVGTFASDTDYYTYCAKRLGKKALEPLIEMFDTAEEEDRDAITVIIARMLTLYNLEKALNFLVELSKNPGNPVDSRKQAVSLLVCSRRAVPLEDIRAINEERLLSGILSALQYCEDDGKHAFAMEILRRPPLKFAREYAVRSLSADMLAAEEVGVLTRLYFDSDSPSLRSSVMKLLCGTQIKDLSAFFTSAYNKEATFAGRMYALVGLYKSAGDTEADPLIEEFADSLFPKGPEDGTIAAAHSKNVRTAEDIKALVKWLSSLSGEEMYAGYSYAFEHCRIPDENGKKSGNSSKNERTNRAKGKI